jgi:putative phage-type endonuclease
MNQTQKTIEETFIETDSLANLLTSQVTPVEDEEEISNAQTSTPDMPDTESMVTKWMEVNREMPQLKRAIYKRLESTQDVLDKIGTFEQKSQEWLDARKFRLTASNFGAAIGHNKYQSKKNLVTQMMWHTFSGNEATRYGEMNEGPARDAYLQYLRKTYENYNISIEVPGLFVSDKYPFLGCSPDGLVTMIHKTDVNNKLFFLLEIKCPFGKKYYPEIPPQYYAQIQGIMELKRLPYCDFVVYLGPEFRIQRFLYNPEYVNKTLMPGLKSFFDEWYLPALIYKEHGLLQHGEIEPTLHIPGKIQGSSNTTDDISFF